jgi:hypothetical protein
VVPSDNAEALAAAMSDISSPVTDLAAMSRRSTELARQFTPSRWAAYVLERTAAHRARLGLPAAEP